MEERTKPLAVVAAYVVGLGLIVNALLNHQIFASDFQHTLFLGNFQIHPQTWLEIAGVTSLLLPTVIHGVIGLNRQYFPKTNSRPLIVDHGIPHKTN